MDDADQELESGDAGFFDHLRRARPDTGRTIVYTIHLTPAKKPAGWRKNFSQKLAPVTIPSHPRTGVGEGLKLVRVFMTSYGDTAGFIQPASQIIESKELQAGYMMFISFTFGYGFYNPLNYKGQIEVILKARLLDGSIIQDRKMIPIVEGFDGLEQIIPGIKEYAKDARTWNAEAQLV